MCLFRIRGGRLAKTMSFLVKHSCTADGDDTITTWRDPNRREKTSPYLVERLCNARWTSGCLLRRWRWPMIGYEGGDGGSFFLFFFLLLLLLLLLLLILKKKHKKMMIQHMYTYIILISSISKMSLATTLNLIIMHEMYKYI
uniref:Uncharacterized protein n=1 Tax=Cannabis sativa TaxID=3483 RepID=A0A803RCD2_CANSA